MEQILKIIKQIIDILIALFSEKKIDIHLPDSTVDDTPPDSIDTPADLGEERDEEDLNESVELSSEGVFAYKRGEKVQVSKNFTSTEFDCKCKNPECEITLICLSHISKLQKLRERLGKSITITSAYRCEKHNKAVGGVPGSIHRTGKATDIIVNGVSPKEVAKEADSFDGVGTYNTFVHVDSRGNLARWGQR